MADIGGFTVTPDKVQQIKEAGRRQLSPEEFEELESLLLDLEIYGFTPWINAQLGKLMAKITWELDIGESPEWTEALQACDYAFLGSELKAMCYEVGASPVGHKKRLCARLYKRKVPEVVAAMEPYLKEMSPERIKEEIERYAKVERLPQTEHLYASKLKKVKDRLEELYRKVPDEFYRRKILIEKAIKEREKGYQRTMPGLTLDELRDVLKSAKGEPRLATTMEERFTIDCSYCGFLTTEKTFAEALETARRLALRHKGSDEKITIFDRLAQRGACNTWDIEGHCLGYKEYKK